MMGEILRVHGLSVEAETITIKQLFHHGSLLKEWHMALKKKKEWQLHDVANPRMQSLSSVMDKWCHVSIIVPDRR